MRIINLKRTKMEVKEKELLETMRLALELTLIEDEQLLTGLAKK